MFTSYKPLHLDQIFTSTKINVPVAALQEQNNIYEVHDWLWHTNDQLRQKKSNVVLGVE
jgi:hypothetical protein